MAQGTCSLLQYFEDMIFRTPFYDTRIAIRFYLILSFALSPSYIVCAQELVIVGELRESYTHRPIAKATVELEGFSKKTETGSTGNFKMAIQSAGTFVLFISAKDLVSKRVPIELESANNPLNLGIIYLDRDLASEKSTHLITLTETDLEDDKDISTSAGLLQATRDIYLTRAAFDFSQAFFRVRGYDSRNGSVLINGILMNKLVDGRPQWNNWGGLNDMTRNQEFSFGLQASDYGFGGLLGTTNINTRPSIQRPGLRFSSSISNRTYVGRLMATYVSGKNEDGWSYALSGSRRWAQNGFIDGTLYDAYSVYGSLEYQYDDKNNLHLTAVLASNRRGRSSAITDEVFTLTGTKYNPYWGHQNGKIRNSRERKIYEPFLMLNHYHSSQKMESEYGHCIPIRKRN